MHELPLLINISIALIVAFIGGTIARKIGLPTIVGYLLAGIIIGPFTPGFVGDIETIRQLAELGVIFLMFGVGCISPSRIYGGYGILPYPGHSFRPPSQRCWPLDSVNCGAGRSLPAWCSVLRSRSPVPSCCCAG